MRTIVAFIILLCTTVTHAGFDDHTVIQHPSETDWTITMQDLRYIYSLKKQYWSTSERIQPIQYPWTSLEHNEFVVDFLNVTPQRLRSTVERRVNSGEGIAPIIVYDDIEMVDLVEIIPGSIGYGDENMYIPDDGTVRKVEIIGR